MSDIEEDSAITETINESVEAINENDGEPTRNLQKVKKPRSEKQIEALKKAQIKRAENIEKRKLEKEQTKKLTKKEKLKKELEELEEAEQISDSNTSLNPSNNGMNEDIDTQALIKKHEAELRKLALKNINKKPKAKKPVKQTIIYESDSSDTEEEEIIIKKKPKKKKKAKKKVVYESSSESESEEEEVYVEPTPQPRQKLRYSEVFRFQ